MNQAHHWIAVDWGTSRLRAWAMSPAGEVLDRGESDQGMAKLTAADYEPALIDLIETWLDESQKRTVIGCGMVGSRQGWVEVPYASVPCRPAAELTRAPVSSEKFEFFICPGVKQEHPADVMRGEETQIAGLLAADPDFAGVVCLPGTHSKWARIRAGEICEFQTFMTGELFALLAEQSILRHTVAKEAWEEAAFLDALNASMSEPVSVSSKLFSLRADDLLHGLDGATARGLLSGYLVGLELAAARRWWKEQDVAVIGAAALSAIYETALKAQGIHPRVDVAEAMTLAGLHAAMRDQESSSDFSPNRLD